MEKEKIMRVCCKAETKWGESGCKEAIVPFCVSQRKKRDRETPQDGKKKRDAG